MRGSATSPDHSKPKNPSRGFETFQDDWRRSNRLKSSRNVSNRLDGFFGFEWSRLVSDPLNSYRYVLLEIQSLKNQSYGLWKNPGPRSQIIKPRSGTVDQSSNLRTPISTLKTLTKVYGVSGMKLAGMKVTSHPAGRSAGHPAERPAGRLAGGLAGRPAKRPAGRPAACTFGRTSGRTPDRTSGRTSGRGRPAGRRVTFIREMPLHQAHTSAIHRQAP